jgi:hypothetical protein
LNPYNAYSVNSITVKGTDGSIASSVPAVARFRIACRPRQSQPFYDLFCAGKNYEREAGRICELVKTHKRALGKSLLERFALRLGLSILN